MAEVVHRQDKRYQDMWLVAGSGERLKPTEETLQTFANKESSLMVLSDFNELKYY